MSLLLMPHLHHSLWKIKSQPESQQARIDRYRIISIFQTIKMFKCANRYY